MLVRTVLGDVASDRLGVTYCHEHLLLRPARRFGEDMVLDDEDRAARELASFRGAGGGAMVEMSVAELGRDPGGLRRLSASTGVTLVAATGHVCEDYWRGVVDVDALAEERLAQEMVSELTRGIGETSVRAGVIKAGSSEGVATAAEAKMLRAAALAHLATGAPVSTHTTAGTGGLEQVQVLEAAGVRPARICIGHLDRRLVWEEHLELARTGVYLGYDQIGKEKYQPDAERAAFVRRMVDEGFGERVLLGGDMARRSYLPSWGGGPGHGFILERFVPRLREHGLEDDAVRLLLEENPARFLSWVDEAGGPG